MFLSCFSTFFGVPSYYLCNGGGVGIRDGIDERTIETADNARESERICENLRSSKGKMEKERLLEHTVKEVDY